MYARIISTNKKGGVMENKKLKEYKVNLTILEIFEIADLLKKVIDKANGGTDDTDPDIISAYHKMCNIETDY